MANGTLIGSFKDALAVGSNIIESAQSEIVWLLPPSMVIFAAQYGIPNKSKTLIEHGGHIKSIFHISSQYVELAQSLLDIGENLRHLDQYEGVFFLVGDKKQSISSIHVNVEELSLDDRIVAFWSETPTYAEYLLTHFDQAWAQGVGAQDRLNELLEQRP
jgi:hypothetical protein